MISGVLKAVRIKMMVLLDVTYSSGLSYNRSTKFYVLNQINWTRKKFKSSVFMLH